MNKIKFRGKRLDNKEWVYGLFARCKIGNLICPCIQIEHECDNGDFIEYVEIDGETLSQYIGLNDRVNNEEIYDGYIVKALNRNYDCEDNWRDYFQTFEVAYLNGCWMFGDWNAHEFFNKYMYIEVIGNKFEGIKESNTYV